jgi:MFS family permease
VADAVARGPKGGAFSVTAYRAYWASQLISGVGTWAQMLAQSWLVLQLTGSAVALGTVTMLQFLPMLVFPLLGGVIADRLPRRRLLLATQAIAMVQAIMLGVLVWSGHVQFWEVCALASVLGLTNAFGNPAQQALVPEIVGAELVGSAVALNSVQFNVARILGGAIGGVAVAVLGIAPTLFLNAASYLPAITVLILLRPAHAVVTRLTGRMTSQIGDGIRYAVGDRAIRRTLALFGVVGLLGFNWSVAVPLLATSLNVGPTGYGVMSAGLGSGSLIAGLFLMRSRVPDERRMVAGGIGMGSMIVLLGLSASFGVSLALMVAAGLAGIMATVTGNTRLQVLSSNEYRGRVMSMFVLLMGGTTPIGGFLLGAIAEAWGIHTGLVIFGSLVMIGLVAILVLDRKPHAAPEPGSRPAPAAGAIAVPVIADAGRPEE